MGRLKWINENGVHYHDHRDSLYYDEYKYRATANIPSLRVCYRYYSYADAIARGTYWNDVDHFILVKNRDIVNKYFEWLSGLKHQIETNLIKVRKGDYDKLIVFSNDLQLLRSLEQVCTEPGDVVYTQAIPPEPTSETNIKYFAREPKHTYRVYLKNVILSPDQKEKLRDFLDKNSRTLYPSKSLYRWLNPSSSAWRSTWLNGTYFIDYDSESMLTYIMLVCGEYVSKSYHLKTRVIE